MSDTKQSDIVTHEILMNVIKRASKRLIESNDDLSTYIGQQLLHVGELYIEQNKKSREDEAKDTLSALEKIRNILSDDDQGKCPDTQKPKPVG